MTGSRPERASSATASGDACRGFRERSVPPRGRQSTVEEWYETYGDLCKSLRRSFARLLGNERT